MFKGLWAGLNILSGLMLVGLIGFNIFQGNLVMTIIDIGFLIAFLLSHTLIVLIKIIELMEDKE